MYTLINIILYILSWVFTIGIFYLFWFGFPYMFWKYILGTKWFDLLSPKICGTVTLLFFIFIICCFITPFIIIRNVDFCKKGIKIMKVREEMTRRVVPYGH